MTPSGGRRHRMISEASRMHDDDKGFIIVAIGVLCAVVIVVSSIVSHPNGSGQRVIHAFDAGGESAPSLTPAVSGPDEVRSLQILTDSAAEEQPDVSTAGRGTRATPRPASETDRNAPSDSATRPATDGPGAHDASAGN